MSRITTVEARAYTVPLPQPEADGTFEWDATTVVVALVGAEGREGIGFTYGAAACADVVRDLLAPRVVGLDPVDVPRAWRTMADAVRNVGRPGVASMAIAAVDSALWDLKAKLAGVPLVELLGRARDAVDVYGSGGFVNLSDDALCDQLVGWVKDGITRVKMKIGVGWGADTGEDLRRVQLARSVIGDDVELFVDANGAYDRKQAARLCPAFEDVGVTWFEEPVTSDDLASLRVLRDQTTVDITAGEYGFLVQYFAAMLDAVDVIQPDASRCGGITEWMQVGAVAAAHSREVSAHCAPSLHLHPACAVDNVRHIEYFADHAYVDPLLFDGVVVPVDGRLRPASDRPGLGLELRGDAERFRVR